VDDLLTAKFGGRVNEAFFRNYIPKVTGLPATEVSEDWFMERYRFYQEHGIGKQLSKKTVQILKSVLVRKDKQASKGLKLYYPKQGAQMLTDMLCSDSSRRGASIRLGARVTGIDARAGRVQSVQYQSDDGISQKAEGDLFVSTLPVNHLVSLFQGALGSRVETAAKGLTWRHLWLFYTAVERERVSDKIQIYFTEKAYPFKRIYEPKNLIPTMGPSGMTALCIEVCYSDGDSTDRSDEKIIARSIEKHVSEFYRVPLSAIHFMFSRRVPFSYAVYKTGYEKHLGEIAASLFAFDNFVSYGRQGSFRYNHLVDRIIDASNSVMNYTSCQREGKKRFLKDPNAKSDFF
jgi:protoporphyrinogen oxidase